MSYSTFQTYLRISFPQVPWFYWGAVGFLSLAMTTFLVIRKKCSVYSAIVLGLTVFIALFLLETAVLLRLLDILPHPSGYGFKAELDRLFHISDLRKIELLANIAVFIPFGFFLSEFFSTTKGFSVWRRIGLATFVGLGLSLCIEFLQLILRVGYFELTDLVMNTIGAFVGSGMAGIGRAMFGPCGKK